MLNALPAAAATVGDETERAVLGAVLLAGDRALSKLGALSAEDFSHPGNAAVWSAIAQLDHAHQPIDPLTVVESMRSTGTAGLLNSLGGEGYVARLYDDVVSVENVGYYGALLAKKAERRRWGCFSRQLFALSIEPGLSDVEFAERAEESTTRMLLDRRGEGGPKAIATVLQTFVTELEARYEGRLTGPRGVPSGIEHLDSMTSGFLPGQLVVLASRPGMGKSALAMNIATCAVKADIPTLVFSLEMSDCELVERVVVAESAIGATKVKLGRLDRLEWIRLTKAAADLSERPLAIDETPALTLSELRARARRWRSQNASPLAFLVVDYLQLMHAEQRRGESREREVAQISAGLKALAKELKVPVLALAQLNRGVESRTDKRPMLSDLRESGAIEADADIVAFLYRAAVYDPQIDPSVAELNIAKHRNGPEAKISLRWDASRQRFEGAR